MTVSEIRKEPVAEKEKPLNFSKLDLWKFSTAKESVKGDFGEDRKDAFEKKSKISLGGEVFDLELFNLSSESNGSIVDNYIFVIKKGRDILLNGKIGLKNNKGVYSAILNIRRNPSERWRHIMSGMGMELYKKLLAFLQNYTDNVDQDVHHVVMKVSDLSDEKWHKKFDPIFENTPGYNRIENDELYKWEKTYHPSRSN